MINGYINRKLPYHQVLAMSQATKRSSISSYLDITPSLRLHSYDNGYIVPVEISNITTRTVSKAILCELQPVTLLDTVMPMSASILPGTTDTFKHQIDMHDETHFKQKYRRIPPVMTEEVRPHIQELIASGVVRHSYFTFSSNMVLVRKQDSGSRRLCIDHRQLRSRTIIDNYA